MNLALHSIHRYCRKIPVSKGPPTCLLAAGFQRIVRPGIAGAKEVVAAHAVIKGIRQAIIRMGADVDGPSSAS